MTMSLWIFQSMTIAAVMFAAGVAAHDDVRSNGRSATTLSSSFSSSGAISTAPLPTAPNVIHSHHDAFLNRIIRNYYTKNDEKNRRLQEEEECSGNPFLWSIHRTPSNEEDDDSRPPLAFGIGTAHYPKELVLTDDAWELIQYAVEDSCTVYGEINFFDPVMVNQLEACSFQISSQGTVFLANLIESGRPESAIALHNQIRVGIEEIVNNYIPLESGQRPAVQDVIETSIPLFTLIQWIQVFNTPGPYRDYYFQLSLFGGTPLSFFDIDLLQIGRPPDSIETAATQCNALDLLTVNPVEFWNDFDSHYIPAIEYSLNSTLEPFFDFYKCGKVDKIFDWLAEASDLSSNPLEDEQNAFIFDERNVQMGEFILSVLDNQPGNAPPSIFAVGLGHWIAFEADLLSTLESNGYTLTRITNNTYNQDTYPNMSNEICDAGAIPTTSPTSTPTTSPVESSPPSTTMPVATDAPSSTFAEEQESSGTSVDSGTQSQNAEIDTTFESSANGRTDFMNKHIVLTSTVPIAILSLLIGTRL